MTGILSRTRVLFTAISLLLLAPCYWQPRLQAGDISSHIYNAWMSQLIESGRTEGLMMVRQTTNILFELHARRTLSVFSAPEFGQRIAVSIVVLVFVWGAFAFVSTVIGPPLVARDAVPRHAGLRLGVPHGLLQLLPEHGAVLLGDVACVGYESAANDLGVAVIGVSPTWRALCR